MAKQTIEIDVPDGCKIGGTSQINYDDAIQVTITLEEEKPEFIEVREFFRRTYDGRLYADSITNGHYCTPDEAEKLTSFIKWIDKDWRKVEI